VLFGLISTRRGLLPLASAGHPTPFIVRASAVERPLLLTHGITELRNAKGDFFEDEMAARPPGDDLAVLCIRVTVGRAVD
jgi:serine phosphatase RsbU (regulator of sigma subunit)